MKEKSEDHKKSLQEKIGGKALLFSGLKNKEASRTMQTFFRSSFRVQMSSFAIADRKANILLRLNSLLITAMILFFKNIMEYDQNTLIAIIIFFLTLLASLFFATLATRPSKKMIQGNKNGAAKPHKENMVMFNSYSHMNQDDFEESFDEMMRDTGMIYKNMALALYEGSSILTKKYKLLRMSYNIFLGGLALTVVSLLVVILITI